MPKQPASKNQNTIFELSIVANTLYLALTLTKREILTRYKGSLIGLGWSLFSPILMMGVFTFVFGEIFSARWPGATSQGGINYATGLFSGLILYIFFADSLGRSPNVLLENTNYIKKVVFPITIIPSITTIASAFQMLCSYLILLILIGFSDWNLSTRIIWVPIIIIPFILLTLGLAWILSSLGVYIRDIGQIVSPLLTALMFLSPALYDTTAIENKFGHLIKLNPLTIPIKESRNVLIYGLPPNTEDLATYWAASTIVFSTGYYLFKKLKKGFADVV